MKPLTAKQLLPAVLLPAVLLGTIYLAASPPAPEAARLAPRGELFRFGAKGDGLADDTRAIQRAVDEGIGEIHFPKGTYRITEPIVIDLDRVGYTSLTAGGVARIVMAGPGPAFKFVGTHFKSAGPEGFEEKVWQRQRMPLVDGLAIVGDHPEAEGIAAVGTMQLTISRVHIRDVLHGIHLLENNRNVIISDCHVYHNRGVGIYYDDVNLHQSNITGCHVSYNAAGGIVSRAGNVRNIHITGCDLESNMSPDRPATANVLIDCRGGSHGTAEVAVTGCTIQHNNPSPGSANIRIIGNSNPSRNLDRVREGNITITGNVLSDVQVNVHLRECRGVTLVGNTFWQGYRHNLLVENSAHVIVGANNLDRNPRYGYGNSRQAKNSVLFRDCEDCTVSGLHVTHVHSDPAGVLLERCRRFNLSDCTILDCVNAGLWLKEVTGSRISGCLIRNNRPGETPASIKITGGADNVVTNNLVDQPIEGGEGSTVEGNYQVGD